MFTSRTRLRSATTAATTAAALVALGAGAANAAGWPTLQEGAYLYSGANGTGTVTQADLSDLNTCHTPPQPIRSLQVVSGAASVVLYSGADCTGSPWASGTLAQSNLSVTRLSYRVVGA